MSQTDRLIPKFSNVPARQIICPSYIEDKFGQVIEIIWGSMSWRNRIIRLLWLYSFFYSLYLNIYYISNYVVQLSQSNIISTNKAPLAISILLYTYLFYVRMTGLQSISLQGICSYQLLLTLSLLFLLHNTLQFQKEYFFLKISHLEIFQDFRQTLSLFIF